ncbi:MAG TPA: GIY-YIG nuclease family protein [Longimicrobiaceae bacterium]|nr:GIY-YIG nuclease family protein [Longimicrobiaceae bacterium]
MPPTPQAALRAEVRRSAENRPGTYRMLAEDGEILYVGKSKQVRTRLLSYFRARDGEKARRILRDAHRIEWEYEPSEFAALRSELRLIKRFRPRHNVQHKRDGRYSFLKLTAGAAPKLLVARHVADDAATYFGPFWGGRRIEAAVRELNDVVGLRDCALPTPMHFADQQELFALDHTPRCHRFELNLCAGPCAARCTQTEYQRRVQVARAFLEGDADEPLRRLTERMTLAAERWDFEYAASLRDRARRIESLRDEFAQLREALDQLSFLYSVPGVGGDDRVYVVRRGTVRAEVPAPRTAAQRRRLARMAEELFRAPETTGALVTKHQVDEILLTAHWFRVHPEEMERTVVPERAVSLPLSA